VLLLLQLFLQLFLKNIKTRFKRISTKARRDVPLLPQQASLWKWLPPQHYRRRSSISRHRRRRRSKRLPSSLWSREVDFAVDAAPQ